MLHSIINKPVSNRLRLGSRRLGILTILVCASACPVHGDPPSSTSTTIGFDSDPGWEGFRNRLLPESRPIVRQDFGYSQTNHAGGQRPGEIGGVVHRAQPRAYYAMAIPTLSFNDRFSASGKFAVTSADGSSGVLIGWFHETSEGWRTPNSFMFRMDGNGGKYWVFYEYGTRSWATAGVGAFEGERYQTTPTKPYPADGTVHDWSLAYDPDAWQGQGRMTFRIDDHIYQLPLSPGHKEDGVVLNRFGILNQQTPGSHLEVYLDDLVIGGQEVSFDEDPVWVEEANRVTYKQRFIRPHHDIGYTQTENAGGARGEIGGIMFRDEQPAYFADRVGPFSLDHKLLASGTIALCSAGSDSGVFLGWFSAAEKRNKTDPEYVSRQTDYVGVMIEGPSRKGHYFRAGYSTSKGRGSAPTGEGSAENERSLILPDRSIHQWSLQYDPEGSSGSGRIRVVFDDVVRDLDLNPGERAEGAVLDRFGFFDIQVGGHHVELYVDDLTYSK
jgi:hypothetical protein